MLGFWMLIKVSGCWAHVVDGEVEEGEEDVEYDGDDKLEAPHNRLGVLQLDCQVRALPACAIETSKKRQKQSPTLSASSQDQ